MGFLGDVAFRVRELQSPPLSCARRFAAGAFARGAFSRASRISAVTICVVYGAICLPCVSTLKA